MFIGRLGMARNRLLTEQEWSEPPVTFRGIPNTPLRPQLWYGATALYGCVVVCFLVK